jgi:hypothetical protein
MIQRFKGYYRSALEGLTAWAFLGKRWNRGSSLWGSTSGASNGRDAMLDARFALLTMDGTWLFAERKLLRRLELAGGR